MKKSSTFLSQYIIAENPNISDMLKRQNKYTKIIDREFSEFGFLQILKLWIKA